MSKVTGAHTVLHNGGEMTICSCAFPCFCVVVPFNVHSSRENPMLHLHLSVNTYKAVAIMMENETYEGTKV